MARKEYKVEMKDDRGRRSFTQVNAASPAEAKRKAEANHPAKKVTDSKETGRSF